MAATVTSVDGERVRATAIESGHGKSHGQSLGPIPLDGWIGATGWPVTYGWRLVPCTNPEPCDRTRFWGCR